MARQKDRTKLYLKNFDLFKIEPAVSISLSAGSILDALEINNLLDHLQDWFIRSIYVFGSLSDQQELSERIIPDLARKFNLYFQFSPDLQKYLGKNPHLIDEILQVHLFSTNQYFKQQKSWGHDHFRFYGQQREVLSLNNGNDPGGFTIPQPEDIEAVYFTPCDTDRINQAAEIKDISAQLDRETGRLKSDPGHGSLIIIRRYNFVENRPLEKLFNYFHSSHLSAIQKAFRKSLERSSRQYDGIFYDLNNLFGNHLPGEALVYNTQLERLYPDLMTDIARHWLIDKKTGPALNVTYKRAMGQFFNFVLAPRLHRISRDVRYFLDSANPLAETMDTGHLFVLQINEDHFEHDTPDYRQTLLQIKRSASISHSKDNRSVPVAIHDLLNTRYSFAEKKLHIDNLFVNGANHIYFRLPQKGPESDSSVFKDLQAIDSNFEHYPEWFSYLHQLGHFLKSGTHRPEVLMLFPGLDKNRPHFIPIIEEIESSGFDYQLLDYDLFNSESACIISEGQINFKNKTFSILLLPAIAIMPLETLRKIAAYFDDGGAVIALSSLPQKAENENEQDEFELLRSRIWPNNIESSSTIYRQNESGGRGYFQPNIFQTAGLLSEMDNNLKIKISADKPGIRFICREDNDTNYIFIVNSNLKSTVRFQLKSAILGRPYFWNFKLGESSPYLNWHIHDEHLNISLKLEASESRLLLIDKKQSMAIWQLAENDFEGCEIIEQSHSALKFNGWQRKTGKYKLAIQKLDKKEFYSYEISRRLPILTVSPSGWDVRRNDQQSEVNLGDLSYRFPFETSEMTYSKTIVLKENYLQNQQLFLDLGHLKDACVLHINGEIAGKRLTGPWRFDVTRFLKTGENTISIRVSNILSNHLAQTDNRYSVQEYGLFGPVKLIPYTRFRFNIS